MNSLEKPVLFRNPYRPGAGHPPPYLAGRGDEADYFHTLLGQDVILENLVLTGLRGVGKTVLLDRFRPIAQESGWLWVGTDLSESASISEGNLAVRLLSDLSVVTSSLVAGGDAGGLSIGFDGRPPRLDYEALMALYNQTSGLVADKLKAVLEGVWESLLPKGHRGVIFAYDEAQNLSDHAATGEYPLSLLLDVFQSLQRRNVPFMLALTGLPTLFPKLVEARTFAERMFHVMFLDKLSMADSREAILFPIKADDCPVTLTRESVDRIATTSGGYPYFVQFICKEVYDLFVQGITSVPMDGIIRKLDADFFAGRWARATDRQRDLLFVAANIENSNDVFTVQELVQGSRTLLKKSFNASHVNQMLTSLMGASLIYKTRHGKYCFAVPLMDEFIRRQEPPEGVSLQTSLE